MIYNYADCKLAYVKCIECILKDPYGLHVPNCQRIKICHTKHPAVRAYARMFLISPYVIRLDSVFMTMGTLAVFYCDCHGGLLHSIKIKVCTWVLISP